MGFARLPGKTVASSLLGRDLVAFGVACGLPLPSSLPDCWVSTETGPTETLRLP